MKKKNLTRFTLLCLLVVPILLFSTDTSKENEINNINDSEELFGDYNEEVLKIPEEAGAYTEASIYVNNNWSDTETQYDWCDYQNGFYIIENVTIDAGGTGSGILINNSKNDYFIIRNCTIINAGPGTYDAGIHLVQTNNGTIYNCNSSNNGRIGILLDEYCENNTISNNIATNNGYAGVHVYYYSHNNTIFNNTIENTYTPNQGNGISLRHHCYNNTITNNTLFNNTRSGIFTSHFCEDTLIANNTLDSNRYGINLESDNRANLYNNTFTHCGVHLSGGGASYAHTIDTSNIANGKPIYYYGNENDLTSDNFTKAGDPAQILLVGCDNAVISDLNLSDATVGIILISSYNNYISNCILNDGY